MSMLLVKRVAPLLPLVLLLVTFCVPGDPARGEEITLILNDPFQFETPGDRCEAEICTHLLSMVQNAEYSIDAAIYGARNQSALLEALEAAVRRGVRLRLVVDRDAQGENYYSSTDEWVRRLGKHNVRDDLEVERKLNRKKQKSSSKPRCPRPDGFEGPLQCMAYNLGSRWLLAAHASREDFPAKGPVNRIMHNKFFVVDGRKIWTGSCNISDSGTGGYNANVALLIDSEKLASLYTQEFNSMWLGKFNQLKPKKYAPERLRIDGSAVSLYFSPQNNSMRYGVEKEIQAARHSIDIAVFFLTNKFTTSDLIAAHRRGVRVRVIVDATSAKNDYTKHELLREAGIPVKVENWGGKMHAKAAVFDRRSIIAGSMNWTAAGGTVNDENTLIIYNRRIAEEFSDFYERLWSSIPERWAAAHARPDPESLDSASACIDGVDNDFDDKIDDKDPGCHAQPPALPDLPPHWLVEKRDEYEKRPPRGYRLIQGKP